LDEFTFKGSLLSTTLVGPTKPRNIVTFGAGQQIEAHIDMHLRHFATLSRCTIVNRTMNARATSLTERLRAKHGNRGAEFNLIPLTNGITDSTAGRELEEAVRAADIIVCATSSLAPLFPSSWVRNGTHVILIGSYKPTMHEIDTALVQRALPTSALSSHQSPGQIPILLVDSREDCLKEAGELITAGIRSDHVTEIGELLETTAEGSLSMTHYRKIVSSGLERDSRNNEDLPEGFNGPVTMFKSVGIGLQDVAIASAVVNKALSLGNQTVGTVVADYDV
jgi:ornithine cyclodeaminase/alanine dehydrogenase-like protein (mu-crystallin family)